MSSLTTLFGDFIKRPYISLTAPPVSKIHQWPDPSMPTEKIDGSTPVSMASSGSMYVMAYSSNGGNIKSSPDGVTWTVRALPTCAVVSNVAYGAGMFMAWGQYTGDSSMYIWTSTNGTTWTWTGVQPEATLLYGKLLDGGNCVIYATKADATNLYFYKSTNGTTWTWLTSMTTGSASGTTTPTVSGFTEVVGSYRFLGGAVNNYASSCSIHRNYYSHYSTNGTTWTAIRASTVAVFYYNSLYYVFDGAYGDIYTTTDFVTYTYFRKWQTRKTVSSQGSYGGTATTAVSSGAKLLNKYLSVGYLFQSYTLVPVYWQVSDLFTDFIQDGSPVNVNVLAMGNSASGSYSNPMTYWYSGISFGNKHWFNMSNGGMACIDANVNELVTL